MTITDEQEEKLLHMFSVIEENRKELTKWESDFFGDQVKRHEEFGTKISFSPKQMAVLDKIFEKCTEV